MRIAYIVGPYRAETKREIIDNIYKASVVAKYYWSLGFAVICPHMNSAHFDGVAADKVFLNGYLTILACLKSSRHLVVVTPGYKKSSGSLAEIKLAEDLSIPITYMSKATYQAINL